MNNWNLHSDGKSVVLHVVNSLTGGGTERALVALLHRLDWQATRHVVVTLREAGPGAANLPPSVACCALNLRDRSRFAFWELRRIAQSWNAQIIHARNVGCWFDAALAALLTPGAQAILGFHGLDHAGPMNKRHRRVSQWAARFGASFTSVSHHGAHWLGEQAEIPIEQVTVLPNGVDTDRFRAIELEDRHRARDAFGLPTDAMVIGAVGSLSPIKRFDLLLDALAQAPKSEPSQAVHKSLLHLLVAGDGPLRASLTKQAERLGIANRVHLIGAVEDVRGILAACDAYVCCSDFEGMSNGLLEALACGLPIVTTRVGDHDRIVRDGVEGLVIEPGNVRELRRAVDRIACDADLRRTMASSARRRAEQFSLNDCAVSYERFYASMLSRSGRSVATDWCTSDRHPPTLWPQATA